MSFTTFDLRNIYLAFTNLFSKTEKKIEDLPEIRVCYHNGCMDGVAAAWVFDAALDDAVSYVEREKMFVLYSHSKKTTQDIIDGCRAKNVYFLDVCPPKEVLQGLLNDERVKIAIWDHHETADKTIESLGCNLEFRKVRNLPVLFNDRLEFVQGGKNECGATVTMKMLGFDGSAVVEKILDYVKDRDIWRWELPFSREFNEGLYAMTLAKRLSLRDIFSVFNGIVEAWRGEGDVITGFIKYAEPIVTRGKNRTEVKNEFVNELVLKQAKVGYYTDPKTGREYRIAHVQAPQFPSEVGNAIMTEEFPFYIEGEVVKCRPDFAVLWWFNTKKTNFSFSFRSTSKAQNVAEIAKNIGGGGHRNAAGAKWGGNFTDLISHRSRGNSSVLRLRLMNFVRTNRTAMLCLLVAIASQMRISSLTI